MISIYFLLTKRKRESDENTIEIYGYCVNDYSQYHCFYQWLWAGTASFCFSRDVQAKLDSMHAAGLFPGATLGIVLEDGTELVFTTGFADVEEKRPMNPLDRIFTRAARARRSWRRWPCSWSRRASFHWMRRSVSISGKNLGSRISPITTRSRCV